MTGTGTSTRLAVAERAAREGAAVAGRWFRRDVDVETKDGQTDVVTRADREAQARVCERLRESYPDEPVAGEESDAPTSVPERGRAWIVDPIDGTNNFVRGLASFATAVAAVADGEPVAAAVVAPALGDAYVAGDGAATRNGERVTVRAESDPERCTVAPTFWWDRDRRKEYAAAARETVERFGDLRRVGSAQVALASLAAGSLDGVFTNRRTHPWDTVAGVHLVRRAGGRVTDLDGEPWRHDARGLVASTGAVHDEVLAAARATDAVRTGSEPERS